MYKDARDVMVRALESRSSVQVQAHTPVIALYSWARHFTFTECLSLRPGVYMGTDEFNAWCQPAMDEDQNYVGVEIVRLSRLMIGKPV